MLEFLRDSLSERKLRLFALACCGRVEHQVTDDRSRKALKVAEQFADGGVGHEELHRAWEMAVTVEYDLEFALGREVGESPTFRAASAVRHATNRLVRHVWGTVMVEATLAMGDSSVAAVAREASVQSQFVRDIVGPLPFHPVTLPPFLLTSRVVQLAQVIYDGRHFGDMPVLADALEEAGCDNEEVLTHCRSGDSHTRGCWVVDLVLGKS